MDQLKLLLHADANSHGSTPHTAFCSDKNLLVYGRNHKSASFTVFILQDLNIKLVHPWGILCLGFECLMLKAAIWFTELSYSLQKKKIIK